MFKASQLLQIKRKVTGKTVSNVASNIVGSTDSCCEQNLTKKNRKPNVNVLIIGNVGKGSDMARPVNFDTYVSDKSR